MTLPALAVVLVLLVHAGGLAVDLVRVHHVARDAARAAVLGKPLPSTPGRNISVVGPSRNGIITATVRLRTRWFSRFHPDLWVTGEASMVAEP